ncbi:hypothetical protein BD310DRAFT_863472 [Dichomitus squalens]|uniref:Uncharacterized protein n=1 Tax=Dichomitus squalens TaxID=114155 RepID=A0A4Q9P9E7_9APHY|nr:hypothetical protein BD310DRAFT_863472 [Dichomitus squalens]
MGRARHRRLRLQDEGGGRTPARTEPQGYHTGYCTTLHSLRAPWIMVQDKTGYELVNPPVPPAFPFQRLATRKKHRSLLEMTCIPSLLIGPRGAGVLTFGAVYFTDAIHYAILSAFAFRPNDKDYEEVVIPVTLQTFRNLVRDLREPTQRSM